MATIGPIYAKASNYNNLGNTYGWIGEDGKQTYIGVHSSQQYASRFQFAIPAIGDGRPVKITSAYIKLYRNQDSQAVPSVTVRLDSRTNSVYSSTKLVAGGGTFTTFNLNESQRNALASKGNSNVWFYFDGMGTRARFTGASNGSYTQAQHPNLTITWQYTTSTAKITSGYYDAAATLTVTKAYSNYTHKVEWLLPDQTVYYTHSLGTGTSSTCTYYGDNSTANSAETLGDFFKNSATVTFYARLTTMTSSGSAIGSTVYSFTLKRPTGYSLGEIEDCNYDVPAVLTFSPDYPTYSHIVKWYIKKEATPVHTETIESTGSTETLQASFDYFNFLDPEDYFTIYSDTCKASVSLETYTTEGSLQGIQSISFKISKPYEGNKIVIDLSPEPIIMDTSVIVTSPITEANVTLNNFFTEFEEYTLNQLHPIGSIYLSYNSTSPSTLFGGTWVSFSPARTLYTTTSASSTQATGGSFTHTLTTTEMPKHRHQLYQTASIQYTGTGGVAYGRASSGTTKAIGSAGSGSAHNNTQPYAVCYMWKRTA